MYDLHAHVIPLVAGWIGSGFTQTLTFGRIRHGDSVQQLLSPQNVETRYPVETLIASLDAPGIERAMLQQGPFHGTTHEYQVAALAAFPDRLWGASRLLGPTRFCGKRTSRGVASMSAKVPDPSGPALRRRPRR